jgi:hypothetical protein
MAKASRKQGKEIEVAQKTSPNRKKRKSVSDEAKHQMVAEAAFYNSLNRAQVGGDPVQDWLLAEKQIEQQLS